MSHLDIDEQQSNHSSSWIVEITWIQHNTACYYSEYETILTLQLNYLGHAHICITVSVGFAFACVFAALLKIEIVCSRVHSDHPVLKQSETVIQLSIALVWPVNSAAGSRVILSWQSAIRRINSRCVIGKGPLQKCSPERIWDEQLERLWGRSYLGLPIYI